MNEENLWGELPVEEKIETPVSILRTQAVALNHATKGLLDARVVQGNEHGEFILDFRIVAPALGNYSASILQVRHPVTLYPLKVIAENFGFAGYKEVVNREEFKDTLKQVFQSDRVRRTVSGLLAQTHDAAATAPQTPTGASLAFS